MAVYTNIGAEQMAQIIGQFDVGALVSAKGIAEGVSNSNWLIETEGTGDGPLRFILTIYESRVDVDDLPFFLGLLDHLAGHDCPVPRTIHDRGNQAYRLYLGKALALIEFLPGVSVSEPTPAQAHAVGAALAQIHVAAVDYPARRENDMGLAAWKRLLDDCGDDAIAAIDPNLAETIHGELEFLSQNWPEDLQRGVIHADLFPDNVLMRGDEVAGVIDFYFACDDVLAYDVAVTHAAWCFSPDGARFDPALSRALLAGYDTVRPLAENERRALPILARAAAMRFIATRVYDWLHTPRDALVTRKDPMAFARRLAFYTEPGNDGIFRKL